MRRGVAAEVLPVAILLGLAGCASAATKGPAGDGAGGRAPVYEQRFLAETRPNPPGVRLRVTVFETAIEGTTRQEFLANLEERQAEIRGRREGAQQLLSSHWRMRWSWRTAPVGRMSCGFRNVTVFLDYQAHYVRLAGPIADDPVVQEWWTVYRERAITRHITHLKALRDAMGQTQRRLQEMSSSTCSILTREANLRAQRELQAIADRLGMTVYNDP